MIFICPFLGRTLYLVTTAIDLGFILDGNLTFNDQVIQPVSSSMSRLAQINRNKHSFGKQSLTTMITALVLSKLFYCYTVWSNTSQTNLSKFQALFRQAISYYYKIYISFLVNCSIAPLFGVTALEQLQAVQNFACRIVSGKGDSTT